MRLLLDTHVLLWALGAPTKLPRGIRADLANPDHEVYVSPASAWEIAIKASVGKIAADVEEVVAASAATGFLELPIRMAHAVIVRALPPLHRDPFDRLLIAQATAESLTLVTRDRVFADYGVPTLWR